MIGDSTNPPKPGQRTKFLPSVNTSADLSTEEAWEERASTVDVKNVEDRVAFLPPLPSEEAIQCGALDRDIVAYVLKTFEQITEMKNISIQWGRAFLRLAEDRANKKTGLPLKRKRTKKHLEVIKEADYNPQGVYLHAGDTINNILANWANDPVTLEVANLSPPRLEQAILPTKMPRSKFITRLLEDGFHLSNFGVQTMEIVRKGTMIVESLILKPMAMRLRFRACENQLAPVLPLQNEVSQAARELFRMHPDDFKGRTAFKWTNWISRRLTLEQKVAREVSESPIRFGLPDDLGKLEKIKSVVHYLNEYCSIDNGRMIIYKAIYSRKRAFKVRTGILREVLANFQHCDLPPAKLREFTDLLDIPEDFSVTEKAFCRCLALADRLFSKIVPNSESLKADNKWDIHFDNWNIQAGILERLDFQNLSQRIRHLNLQPKLRAVLQKLEEKSQSQENDFPPIRPSEPQNGPLGRLFGKPKKAKTKKIPSPKKKKSVIWKFAISP